MYCILRGKKINRISKCTTAEKKKVSFFPQVHNEFFSVYDRDFYHNGLFLILNSNNTKTQTRTLEN